MAPSALVIRAILKRTISCQRAAFLAFILLPKSKEPNITRGKRTMSKTHHKDTRYKKNPAVVCTEFDEGAILLDLNTKYYYNLNETALSIWKSLNELSSTSEISERLVAEYEVEENRVLGCVRRMIAELCKNGLVIAQ
jgi:hypothetical protein